MPPMKTAVKNLSLIALAGLVMFGCSKKPSASWSTVNPSVSNQLVHFVAEKKAQATADAARSGKGMVPDINRLFAAAEKGDSIAVSNIFQKLSRRAPDFEGEDHRLHGTQWQAAKEVWGAFDSLAHEGEERVAVLGRGIIDSIPPGSIYFGGTDPGRWVITALQKSHVNGDPFFTLTQNAMVDPTYRDYLQSMYGAKIYVPTIEDSGQCFSNYMQDVQGRILHDNQYPAEPKQIKPGEDVSIDSLGHVQVSGQVAVMAVNAELAKVVFDHEPSREFFVEESFPLDWMYPHLEPHGAIMKINREPLLELSDEVVRKDHDFWVAQINPVIGDWLNYDTPVQDICAFAQKVVVQHDLNGFKGDPQFITAEWLGWMSKLRSSIAGVYSWRAGIPPAGGIVPSEYQPKDDTTRQHMIKEADFAYRQAFALCPSSPEASWRYANFLSNQRRSVEALAIAEVAMALHKGKPDEDQFRKLLETAKAIQSQLSGSQPKN
jgi:hypothetical protein